MKSINAFNRCFVTVLFTGLFISTAHADREWNLFDGGEPDSGNFGVEGNWDPVGVPTADHWVIFNNEATDAYTVTLEGDSNRTIKGMSLQKDNVILDLNGNELTMPALPLDGTKHPPNFLMGTVSGPATMVIQDGTGATGDGHFKASFVEIVNGSALTVRNGATFEFTNINNHLVNAYSLISGSTVSLANGGELITRVTLFGKDTTVNVNDGGILRAMNPTHVNRGGGSGGEVVFNVNSGGQMFTTSVAAGREGDSTFNITGGSATSTGALTMGLRSGIQTINITDAGSWEGTVLNLSVREADQFAMRGYVTVDGTNSTFTLSGNATIGSTALGDGSHVAYDTATDPANERAWLTVTDGGKFSAGGDMSISYMGRLTIDRGDVEAGSLVIRPHVTMTDTEETKLYAEYAITLYGDMVDGPAPFRVTGNADIGEGELDFSFTLDQNYTPEIGHTFTILSYGTLDTSHYFLNRQPNSTVTFEQDSVMWELNYGTGSNSAITLTVIPEPHTLGLLLAAGALIVLRRRKR